MLDILTCVFRYIHELQPLFEIDPMLLRFCIKVIPLEDVYQLICKVPTSILLMRLAEESSLGYQVVSMFHKHTLCSCINIL